MTNATNTPGLTSTQAVQGTPHMLAVPPDAQRTGVLMQLAHNDSFFSGGHPFPWNPPGPEFWTAILDARKKKNPLEKSNWGPPNAKANKADWVVVEKTNQETGEVTRTRVPPPAFKYVSADQYIEELDRVCLPASVAVLPSATVSDATGQGNARSLNVAYYVAHAPTGQGMVLRADVPISSGSGMGDPVKKAYTNSWSMFTRGFLAIPGADEGSLDEERRQQHDEERQQYYDEGQQQHRGRQENSDQRDQRDQRQYGGGQGQGHFQGGQQGHGQGNQGGQSGARGNRPSDPNAHHQGQGHDRNASGGGPGGPPRGVVGQHGGGQVPQGRQDSLYDDPLVNQAQDMLEARDVANGDRGRRPQQQGQQQNRPQGNQGGQNNGQQNRQPQGRQGGQNQGNQQRQNQGGYGPPPQGQRPNQQQNRQQQRDPEPDGFPPQDDDNNMDGNVDLGAPPPPYVGEPLRGVRPDEPQTIEDWVKALVVRGWDEQMAQALAAHKPDEPIGPTLRGEIASIALGYFDGDKQKFTAAFEGTGFTPQPHLPEEVKPKPTGLQLLRFTLKIDLKSKNTTAAAATA